MYGFPVVDIIVLLFIVFSLLPSFHKVQEIYRMPQSKFFIVFVVAILLSNLMNGHFDMLVTETMLFLKIIIFYFFVSIAIDSPDQLKNTVLSLIFMMIFIAYQGILQFDTGLNWAGEGLDRQGRMHWVGNFDGANITSAVFVITIPFLLEFIFGKWGIFLTALSMLATYFAVYGIYLTNSRAGFLGIIVVVSVFCFQKSKRKILSVVLVMLVVVGLMAVAPSRMNEIDDKDKSTRGRIAMWGESLDMLKYYPLFGIGKGRFEQYTHDLVAHNAFLQNLGETGLTGSYAWIGMIYASIVGMIRVLRKDMLDPKRKSLYRGLFNSFLGLLFCLIFISADFELIYIWVAIITAVMSIEGIELRMGGKEYAAVGGYVVALVAGTYIVINLFKRIYL